MLIIFVGVSAEENNLSLASLVVLSFVLRDKTQLINTKNGLLNDQLFAQARANSLFRKGASIRMIRSKLIKKGISNTIIDKTIAELASEWKDPDWKAAIRFSQRKKLGPFRSSKNRDDFVKRDLASLGRAGFSFAVAKKIVHAFDIDCLNEDGGC